MQYEHFLQGQKKYQEELEKPQTTWPEQVQIGMHYIQENLFEESLTVTRIREACHINDKSFASRFKIYTGFYPKDYILNHRIEFGKYLLIQEGVSIVQVGLLLGFSSHSAFCKAFKVRVGMRPSVWAKDSIKVAS